MAVTDKKMDSGANAAKQCWDANITTAINQTGLLVYGFTPGFRGQITKVSAFASSVTATITVDVQIAGTTVLTGQITPVAGSEVAGTLTSTLANLRFKSTDQIQVKYTTNGSGAATNLSVTIQARPYPMNQDAAL